MGKFIVSEPLRAMYNGAPLEDARHLTHRYNRIRQEFEIQAAEVIRRRSKFQDSSPENLLKLKSSENNLTELKSSVLALGKEATSAMLSVEDQQQEITFQKLLALVEAERSYHQSVLAILEKMSSEMVLKEEREDLSMQQEIPVVVDDIPSVNDETASVRSTKEDHLDTNASYFNAKVVHSFDAQADGELTLETDDHVLVRQRENAEVNLGGSPQLTFEDKRRSINLVTGGTSLAKQENMLHMCI